MTPGDFKELALALREAGAVKVRAGELEVIWPGPYTPSAAAQNGLTRTPPTNGSHGQNGRASGPTPRSAEELRLREFKAELEGSDDV